MVNTLMHIELHDSPFEQVSVGEARRIVETARRSALAGLCTQRYNGQGKGIQADIEVLHWMLRDCMYTCGRWRRRSGMEIGAACIAARVTLYRSQTVAGMVMFNHVQRQPLVLYGVIDAVDRTCQPALNQPLHLTTAALTEQCPAGRPTYPGGLCANQNASISHSTIPRQ